MIKKAIYILLFLFLSLSISEAASVWKVSSKKGSIYLGGTVHMLRKSDFPLPEEFDLAYKDSSTLLFETDHAKLQDPEILKIIITKSLLNAMTLEQVLSPNVYKALSEYCVKVGLPMKNINQFKPSMAMLTIVMVEYQKLGIDQDGVDMHFYNKGITDQKKIRYFESVDEQIDFLVSMGEGYEDTFVLQSIKDMKKAREIFLKIMAAWEKGDRKALIKAFIHDMKKRYPLLYKKLLVDRNRKWMSKIESFINTNDKTFVLVGAAHLVGEDGILTKLEQLGYKVEKFEK